jgi:predicted  nucleic acid-binding Zn-ribbon protein
MSTEQKSNDTKSLPNAIDNNAIPEWLTTLLSALGSMGGSYMLWIKPLQERMDDLTNQINTLKTEIKELKQQNTEYKKGFENNTVPVKDNIDRGEYLPVKRSMHQGSYFNGRI